MEIRNRIVELRYMRAGDLAENPRNWRTHPKHQQEAMKKVLAEVGFAGAALAYLEGEQVIIIDGHMRRNIDPQAEIPVLITDLSQEEADVVLATYDPLAAMAETNRDKLRELLQRAGARSEDMRAALARIGEAMGAAMEDEAEPPADPGPQIDRAEELQEKWQVARGDVWQIGAHRLMCGDSTSAEDVARLMGGEKAVLVVADPPYGVDYVRGKYDGTPRKSNMPTKILGDNRKGLDQQSFICDTFSIAQAACKGNATIYMWSAPLAEGAHSLFGLLDAGIHVQSQLIWNKSSLVLGRRDYHWKHEICWYGYWNGKERIWNGQRDQTTVIDDKKISASFHPNEKPVSLAVYFINNSSLVGSTIFDPFLGSGTTLVACEQTGRCGYGMEIAEKYCAVTLERLAGMGLEPARVESS
jgi:DNA modification methylase